MIFENFSCGPVAALLDRGMFEGLLIAFIVHTVNSLIFYYLISACGVKIAGGYPTVQYWLLFVNTLPCFHIFHSSIVCL